MLSMLSVRAAAGMILMLSWEYWKGLCWQHGWLDQWAYVLWDRLWLGKWQLECLLGNWQSNVLGLWTCGPWVIWLSWGFCHLFWGFCGCGMITGSSFAVCMGLYNDCSCCKHGRTVPLLDTCLGVGMAMFVAVGEEGQGISVDRRCC